MKAMELDDTVAETHFTLAGFRAWSEMEVPAWSRSSGARSS